MNSHAQLLERAMLEKIDQSHFVIKLFPEEGICIIWGNFLLWYDAEGVLKRVSLASATSALGYSASSVPSCVIWNICWISPPSCIIQPLAAHIYKNRRNKAISNPNEILGRLEPRFSIWTTVFENCRVIQIVGKNQGCRRIFGRRQKVSLASAGNWQICEM